MKKICGIYVITNKINGKQYVGCSINCRRRWYDHRSKSINSKRQDDINKLLYLAIRKYGLDNFTFEIVEECESTELYSLEIQWIKKLQTFQTGYNLTEGGTQGSEYTKHVGEQHGKARLTEQQVVECRQLYAEGQRAKEVWEKYFSNVIKFQSFQRMWHGYTWKHVMPEVFKNKPHTRRKTTDEERIRMKELHIKGLNYAQIREAFDFKYGHATIWNIIHDKKH